MEQNIREICNINIHINIINAKCHNNSHEDVDDEYHKGLPCQGCKNIVCKMCCNQERNKCIACYDKQFSPDDKCEICKYQIRYYMCAFCSKIITRCNIFCKNATKFSWENHMLICQTCEQK